MREEQRERIEAHFEVFAKWMRDKQGIDPELVIREGEPVDEIMAQVSEDDQIGVLVLGAGSGKKGPGPLVTQLTKNAGTLPMPITIVPGDLSKERLRRSPEAKRSPENFTGRKLPQMTEHGAIRPDIASLESFQTLDSRAGRRISGKSRKGRAMFIQTESTPNPATLKFLPGQTVLDTGTADFPTPRAEASPLVARIFKVPGVAGVFLGNDFVTVTKAEEIEWDHIKPAILGAIMEHFQSGQPVMTARAAARRAMPSIAARIPRSSARSRNFSTPACGPPWRRMAATSPFTGSSAASSTCTCRGPARAARPRPSP